MAKHGNFRTSIEYAAARIVLSLVGALPIKLSMWVGRAFGRIAYLLASELRRTGEINLNLAFPQKTAEEKRELLKGCFDSLGRLLGLFSHFCQDQGKAVWPVVESEGVENIEQAQRKGCGVIPFTAHFGAWELTSFGLALLGHPFTFLVRPIDNPKIEAMVDRYRRTSGNETLDKFSAARSMLKIIRSGGMVGLLFDLNALDEEAIFVDFFGVPASTNFTTAKLALRTGAPIVPSFAPWDKERGKYLLKFLEPIEYQASGNEEDDVRGLTARLIEVVEREIRLYPEQWLWVHKRWKTRPKGEPAIY